MIKHIYIGSVPDEEISYIPSDTVEITNPKKYFVTQASGFYRPDADIAQSALAGANASRSSGARINNRNIVMDITIVSGDELDRVKLYDIFPFDKKIRVYVETETRAVFIDGKVEKVDGDEIARKLPSAQISILCDFPWFQSVQFYEKTFLDKQMVAVNHGDIPCGFTFYIDDIDDGNTINLMTNFELLVGDAAFRTKPTSDKKHGFMYPMIFCTIPGMKMFSVEVNGIYADVAFSIIDASSEWMLLQPGENIVSARWTTWFLSHPSVYDPDEWMRLTYRDTYSGV